LCAEVKTVYYQQYVKNPQLRTSAFYPCQHPHVRRSSRPHFTIGRLLGLMRYFGTSIIE